MWMQRGLSGAVTLILLAGVTGCSDGPVVPDDTPPLALISTLVVSAPGLPASRTPSGPTISRDGASFAYLSAVPGSVSGTTASITNRTRNRLVAWSEEIVVPIVDGGIDPVRVPASPDDTLEIKFLALDQSILMTGATVVPRIRPPKIVRTSPRPGKKDVPLNTRIEIIFSEPIDPATLTPPNIQVWAGSAPISGSLGRVNDYAVEFVPAEPLRPATSYEIVITTSVRSVIGISLEAETSISFETTAVPQTSPPPPPPPPVTPSEDPMQFTCPGGTPCFAFTRQGEVFTLTSYNSPAVRVLADASTPSWSPDGSQFAFTRPDRLMVRAWEVCISDRPGQDVRCASIGETGTVIAGPAWSPDGTRVAFSTHICSTGQCTRYFSSIRMLDPSSMQVTTVGNAQVTALAWSPNGSKIAYAAFGAGLAGRGALFVMNKDGSGNQEIGASLGWYSVRGVAWSPDGTKLGLALNDENACPWYCDTALGIVNADGSGLNLLVRGQTAFQNTTILDRYVDYPVWSPDGSLLTYTWWGWCYDIDPGCFSEIRAWDVKGGWDPLESTCRHASLSIL